MKKLMIAIVVTGIALTGCKKKEEGGGGGPLVDVSGYWVGKWVSTMSQDSGGIMVKLSQNSQGDLSGWIYFSWNDSLSVSGHVSGYDIEFGYVGNDSTTYSGQVSQDGNHAEGTYTVRDNEVIDEGTWEVDRVQPNWSGTWNGTIYIGFPPDSIVVIDGKWDAAFSEYTRNDTTYLGGFIWIYYNSNQDTIAKTRPAAGIIHPADSIYITTQVNVNGNRGSMVFTGAPSGVNYSGTWNILPYPDIVNGQGNWQGGRK